MKSLYSCISGTQKAKLLEWQYPSVLFEVSVPFAPASPPRLMQGSLDAEAGYDPHSVIDLAQALSGAFLIPSNSREMASPPAFWPPSPAETDRISHASGSPAPNKGEPTFSSTSSWPMHAGDAQSAAVPMLQDTNQQPPDPVCQSILICPPNKGDGSNGVTPDWTPERVRLLCSLSPLIKTRVEELRLHSELWWTPVVGDGIDESTAIRVLDLVGPGTAGRKQRVSLLSQECNAMWAFQINPTLFPASLTWQAVDDDGQLAASRTVVRKAARRSYASISSSSSSPRFCWQTEPGSRSRLTSLQLANIAIVLEWEEAFKREIRTVIWDWTGQSQVLATPVGCLQAHGPRGLEAQRKIEKDKVLTHMRDYLERQKNVNKTSVKRIYKDLELQNMKLEASSFLHPSIYSMLREIEGAILKEKRSANAGGGVAQLKTVNPNRPTTPGLLGKIKEMEHSVENMMSGGKAHRKFVQAMLAHVQEFVAMQQKALAEEMWNWRVGEVRRWSL
ncbi:hypothetical protein QBC36DRAFT_338126 [Triangularia setosa]|uniref:Uncharacterized protein n=1 Tax=Triangularia setosa TaxID=2587417 RepID=A0AAN7A1Y6_9PEZI|nr:hypothetical protein QBC36DRAFT_338126 [Podospora setosa]